MSSSFACLIEFQRPVQIAVVRQRQGVHPQGLGALQQVLDLAGSVQQAVMAMTVQMYKRRRALMAASTCE